MGCFFLLLPLSGSMDISIFKNLGVIELALNPGLTAITLPVSSKAVTALDLNGCDVRTLDCSGLSGLGGIFKTTANVNLTSITLPNSSQVFTEFQTPLCNLKNINCSGLTGLGGLFDVSSNSSLTAVTFPASTQNFTSIHTSGCSLSYLNLLPISASSSDNISISFNNNSWKADVVNHMLYDLDIIGWTGGTMDISGTNEAPDASSGGYNGTVAKASLDGKGWTITTT